MLIFTQIHELKAFIEKEKSAGKIVGFVPTMGALHPGHVSLLRACQRSCDTSVCSIFVNPTQFNDKADLARYPRTPGADTQLLEENGCNAVFIPSNEVIYPKKDERQFDFGYLDKILEGAHRPGHFNGVAQVVSRLFDIVEPHKAFFGEKDFQQVMVIKTMTKMLKYKVEIVVCPTLREKDGLAMSSRNALLNAEERKAAAKIPFVMKAAREMYNGCDVKEITEYAVDAFKSDPIYKLDYFKICDADTLKEISSFSEAPSAVALIACFVGKIRLIDNLRLR